jgi:DNA-binding NarL/FixJ family response regulator
VDGDHDLRAQDALFRRLARTLDHTAELHQQVADVLTARPGAARDRTRQLVQDAAARAAAARRLASRVRTSTPVSAGARPPRLTPRELAVAGLIARGLRDREIADQLRISPRTAESHAQHIYRKLGVRNRARLVAWYLRNVGS